MTSVFQAGASPTGPGWEVVNGQYYNYQTGEHGPTANPAPGVTTYPVGSVGTSSNNVVTPAPSPPPTTTGAGTGASTPPPSTPSSSTGTGGYNAGGSPSPGLTGGYGASGSPMTNPYGSAVDANANLASVLAAPSAAADALQAQQSPYQSTMAPAGTGASRFASAQPSSSSNPNFSGDVWVTVPVDKVVAANGKGTVTPVYATTQGYQQSAHNAIPPTSKYGSM